MLLTEEQKAEIGAYIVSVPKYRETYNELYDHILNSLLEYEGEFDLSKVDQIVNRDFCGYYEIAHQEKIYQKAISIQYNGFFRTEILNTFKWPEVINNVAMLTLCLVIYYTNKDAFNMKPIILASIFCCIIIAVFGFTIILKNRYHQTKYSILDNYLGYSCSFGLILVNFLLGNFLKKESFFEISNNTKLIITLLLFFFSSVYVRAFIKFYNQRIKVLSA
jgi:hypothetical protein